MRFLLLIAVLAYAPAQAMDEWRAALLFELNAYRDSKGLEPFGVEPLHQFYWPTYCQGGILYGGERANCDDNRQPYWKGGWHHEKNRLLSYLELCRHWLPEARNPPLYGDSVCQIMMVMPTAPAPGESAKAWAKRTLSGISKGGCFAARIFDKQCTKPTSDPDDGHVIDGRQFRRIAINITPRSDGRWAVMFFVLPRKG